MKKILILTAALCLVLSGCSSKSDNVNKQTEAPVTVSETTVAETEESTTVAEETTVAIEETTVADTTVVAETSAVNESVASTQPLGVDDFYNNVISVAQNTREDDKSITMDFAYDITSKTNTSMSGKIVISKLGDITMSDGTMNMNFGGQTTEVPVQSYFQHNSDGSWSEYTKDGMTWVKDIDYDDIDITPNFVLPRGALRGATELRQESDGYVLVGTMSISDIEDLEGTDSLDDLGDVEFDTNFDVRYEYKTDLDYNFVSAVFSTPEGEQKVYEDGDEMILSKFSYTIVRNAENPCVTEIPADVISSAVDLDELERQAEGLFDD